MGLLLSNYKHVETKIEWNHGANSNQLYRPEGSLTGGKASPADITEQALEDIVLKDYLDGEFDDRGFIRMVNAGRWCMNWGRVRWVSYRRRIEEGTCRRFYWLKTVWCYDVVIFECKKLVLFRYGSTAVQKRQKIHGWVEKISSWAAHTWSSNLMRPVDARSGNIEG
jgi:hypothetical protein